MFVTHKDSLINICCLLSGQISSMEVHKYNTTRPPPLLKMSEYMKPHLKHTSFSFRTFQNNYEMNNIQNIIKYEGIQFN